ncbi:PH domain-containing protein [Specibacter cremeus]|uniref:PH domain-containing protein n=1 Tax=Specibacter cremeus TaxID=1629051 RepID=UPI00197C69AF|nr:PH domain-containing protein [Specibacter cremeus]
MLRTTSARLLPWAAWVICAFFAVNLLWTGTWTSIRTFLPWLLFAAWVLYVLLWRPCIVVDDDGVRVRNLLRDHAIPFDALVAVRVGQTVSLDTTAGRIPAWGAPGAGKLGPRVGARGATGETVRGDDTQGVINRAWDAWDAAREAGSRAAEPGRTVRSRWNVPVAVVGLVLVILAATTFL